MSSSAQRELESLANQHGLLVRYDRQSDTDHPSLYTVSVSVDSLLYSAANPNENVALDMASSHALSDLRQRLVQRISSDPHSTSRYIITSQHDDHGTPSPSHHAATQPHYRMQLNNMAAVRGLSPVEYERENYSGPEHNPCWTSTVYVGGVRCGQGFGRSKGAAREQAAQQALEYLAIRNYEYSGRLPSS